MSTFFFGFLPFWNSVAVNVNHQRFMASIGINQITLVVFIMGETVVLLPRWVLPALEIPIQGRRAFSFAKAYGCRTALRLWGAFFAYWFLGATWRFPRAHQGTSGRISAPDPDPFFRSFMCLHLRVTSSCIKCKDFCGEVNL